MVVCLGTSFKRNHRTQISVDDDFDPEHDDLYLVPDPGDEEEGGGEEEDHQGCGGLALPHTCTERYLFSSQTYFYGENPWLHYMYSRNYSKTISHYEQKSLSSSAKNIVSKALL